MMQMASSGPAQSPSCPSALSLMVAPWCHRLGQLSAKKRAVVVEQQKRVVDGVVGLNAIDPTNSPQHVISRKHQCWT